MDPPEIVPGLVGVAVREARRPRGDAWRGRGRGLVRPESAPYALLVAVIAFAVLYPAYRLVWRSFHVGATASITFVPYRDLFTNALTRVAFVHSLVIGVSATAAATVVGVALAWLVTRTNLPAAAVFRLVFALPFYVPSFIGAIAWLQIIGPVGYVNQAYKHLTGASDPLIRPYGA
ncbi:MAG: hypothetical protein M3008_10525, partial [Chloroflexota bacterium]|nr:hypothetical protein [Chloroflexota bacterium]